MQSTTNTDQLVTLTTNTDQLSTLTTTTNIQTSGTDQLIDATITALPNCHKHPRPCKDEILIWSYNTGGLGGTPNERRGNLQLLREMGADIAVYSELFGRQNEHDDPGWFPSRVDKTGTDRKAGVAILLSPRLQRLVIRNTRDTWIDKDSPAWSRVTAVWVQFRFCRALIVGVHFPLTSKTRSPTQKDVIHLLNHIFKDLKPQDCVILAGDMNNQLPRNAAGHVTGPFARWRRKKDKHANRLLAFLRKHKLAALNTFFKPRRNSRSVTHLSSLPNCPDSQIDYIFITRRWINSCKSAGVRWAPSIVRYGALWDHGCVYAKMKWRVKRHKKKKLLRKTIAHSSRPPCI